MNCPNCGRILAEGEVCHCMEQNLNPEQPPVQPQVNPMPETQPLSEPQPNTYTQPQYAPQGEYYNPGYTGAPYAVPTYNPADPNYQQPYYTPEMLKQPARTDYPEGYKIKRKYVAVLLGAFLGALGIHNFYLGNSSKAIAQLLLSTVGALLFGLGPVAASIWAIVETVQILTENIDRDANGYKIQTFEEALVKTRMDAERKANEE